MKKIFSKKSAILLLAFSNAAVCALFMAHQFRKAPPPRAPSAEKPRKAIVKEAKFDQSALQSCYEQFLQRGPKTDEGVVVVNWMIDPSGKITSLKLMRTDLDDQEFVSCVLDHVQAMTLTPPSRTQSTLVAHTFNFHRKSESQLDFKTE
jgi:hypothetical protein